VGWWLLFSLGLNRLLGIGLAENWQIFVAMDMLFGLASVGVGLVLRWLLVRRRGRGTVQG
jgi:hypothetical protein